MIADGDNKVYKYIQNNPNVTIYEGIDIEKFECANHLQKRAHKSLFLFGEKYNGEGTVRSTKKRAPLDPNTPSVAKFFATLPKDLVSPIPEPSSDPAVASSSNSSSPPPPSSPTPPPPSPPPSSPTPPPPSPPPSTPTPPPASPPPSGPTTKTADKSKIKSSTKSKKPAKAQTKKPAIVHLPPKNTRPLTSYFAKVPRDPTPSDVTEDQPLLEPPEPLLEPPEPLLEPPEPLLEQPEPAQDPSDPSSRRSGRLAKKPRIGYEGLDNSHVSDACQASATAPSTKAKTKRPDKPSTAKGPSKKRKGKTGNTQRRSQYTMHAIRTYFSNLVCFAVSQLYRMAVYANCEAGPEAQSEAVQAVLWHELDRPDATPEERQKYHQYCKSSWCEYQQWIASGQPADSYVRLHAKDNKGNQVPWKGGHYSRMDIDYPDCFQGVVQIFETLGCITLMKRCQKKVTQNLNESVHGKLWRKVLKFKKHTKPRFVFGCIQIIMEHNFGHKKDPYSIV